MALTVTAGICEDDDELRGTLRTALEREGYAVKTTVSGADAVGLFTTEPPDVLVLDIGLPDADGRDVCQALRARGVSAPVLFLTARDALPDRPSGLPARLRGFPAGGADYRTKPFQLAELLVRLQALVRRGGMAASEPRSGIEMILDPESHALVHGDARVALTPTEFRLLAALAARPGAVLRRHELVAAGWPEGAIVHDNTL